MLNLLFVGGVLPAFTLYWVVRAIWQLRAYYKTDKIFRKMPGLEPRGMAYYFMGNFDMMYYGMEHLNPLKAMFQLYQMMISFETDQFIGLQKFYSGWVHNVVLYSASTLEPLVTSSQNINKSSVYPFLDKWLGNGLLTSSNDHWRKHRKILTPSFHFRILDSFVPIMNENSGEMIESIVRQSKPVDIRSYVTNCTLDSICETAMGVRVAGQVESHDYLQPLNRVMELLLERMITPLYFNQNIYRLTGSSREYNKNLRSVHRFVNKVIEERSDEMQKLIKQQNKSFDLNSLESDDVRLMGGKKRYAFLDSLLVEHFRNPNNFTMQEIRDEVNTFMFEGHDTTSSGLIFALLLIGGDQRVQDKIYEELETIYGDDMNRPITIDDCREMKYLEMSLKESFRVYPPVPSVGRSIEHDFEVNGYIIPAGCECSLNFYMLHRDPSVFPDPERFIPERFEPGAPIHRQPYAYLPFSAGPRNCIGQKFAMLESKIMVASILRKFRLVSITKRDQVDVEASLVLKANSPVMVRFEPRRS